MIIKNGTFEWLSNEDIKKLINVNKTLSEGNTKLNEDIKKLINDNIKLNDDNIFTNKKNKELQDTIDWFKNNYSNIRK